MYYFIAPEIYSWFIHSAPPSAPPGDGLAASASGFTSSFLVEAAFGSSLAASGWAVAPAAYSPNFLKGIP